MRFARSSGWTFASLLAILVTVVVGALFVRGSGWAQPETAETCPSGILPAGSQSAPADLEITKDCTVDGSSPSYFYHNVNIYNGGKLEFRDAKIDFFAESILVENDSSLVAGSPTAPITDGQVTIHLYGPQNELGITCKTPGGTCGVPPEIWTSNLMTPGASSTGRPKKNLFHTTRRACHVPAFSTSSG